MTTRKRRVLSLILVIVLALGFTACGRSSKSTAATPQAAPVPAYGSYAADMAAEAEDAWIESPAEMKGESGFSSRDNGQVPAAANMAEKIIYNAEVTLETTEFDAALDRIQVLVAELGGFMESTSISGSNYSSISRGNVGTRSAYFTIRIPSEHFNTLTGSLSDIGNVPYSRTYSRNITTQYYDTQSRLDAYRVQEKRLLEMLSIAETVEDMLAIQRELTDVQYELDSLTGTLRYYDNQVGYSTVNLDVQEVRDYTPEPTVRLTYWERMEKGFRESLKATGRFFTELFLWLVTSLPWLVPLAVVLAVLIALLRRKVRRDPERARARAERREAKRRRRAERKARKNGGDGAGPEEK